MGKDKGNFLSDKYCVHGEEKGPCWKGSNYKLGLGKTPVKP